VGGALGSALGNAQIRKNLEKVRKKCPSKDTLWLWAIVAQPEKSAKGYPVTRRRVALPENEEADN
jgi:hypothetical protein